MANIPLKKNFWFPGRALRGAAAIVFAIFSINSGAPLANDIYHIVFCVALLSVSLQGSMLPFLAQKLHLVDHSGNVLMTFNDYQDETDLFLREVHLDEHHPLGKLHPGCGRILRPITWW